MVFNPRDACEQAGLIAEQTHGLPAGLLLAIGRVESGRWDSGQGRTVPWPWTINAAGKGAWFETPDEAVRTVRALLESGTRSVDTGCFQINLMYHPAAFGSLEQAFDPMANAGYAARFLVDLYARHGSWEAAVEAYHSADPVRGFAYRQMVYASWSPPSRALQPMTPAPDPGPRAPEARARVIPAVYAGVAVWTPIGGSGGANVVGVRNSFPAQPPPPGMPPLPVVIPHRFIPGR